MAVSVLIVDDDDVVGRVLGRILARDGYDVWRATGAGAALALAGEVPLAAALVDLCLPDGDGVGLGRQLRDGRPGLATVLMTAYPVRLRERPELAAEFDRVLIKPLDLAELRQALRDALARHGAAAPVAGAAAGP